MNKKWWLIIIILIVAAVAVGCLLLNNQEETTVANLDSNQTTSSGPQQSNISNTSQYVEYNPEVLAQTSGTKILFFHAPWCPQCRALEKSIKEGPVPGGVTFIEVDYDSNQDLRQKYGVTIQTTLVKVDDQGNLVEKYVAYNEPTLQAVVDNLL